MEEEIRFYQRPWARVWIQSGFYLLLYLVLSYFGKNWSVGIDLVIFGVLLILWMFFFSQFVLPVSKIEDRRRIFSRLLFYLFGIHGAANFVENGRVRERPGESEKRGVGVLWLDSASAAVLRSETAFTRTVGPGVHFLSWGEYIHRTVDLHTQTYNVGPGDKDDPFTIKPDHEDYATVMGRRRETSVLTRDGIEVVAAININFGIASSPESAQNPLTPFGINRKNVERFVTRNASAETVAKIVVDIWREYIRQIRFDQLFENAPGKEPARLPIIIQMVNDRLSKPLVDERDEFGRPREGRQIASPEYELLQEMGIRANANIRRLFFAPEVEDRLRTQWTTNWLKNARNEREQVERVRAQRQRMGQDEAFKEFAVNASQEVGKYFPTTEAKAVEMLTHSTLRGVLRNAAVQRRLTTEPTLLSEIVQYMREHDTSGAASNVP
jgi:SPFH domain/Band 7 family protein